MATYWENSCSFGLRYVSWYKFLIVNLVFSHLGFWSGNLFLITPFPDLCLFVPFSLLDGCGKSAVTGNEWIVAGQELIRRLMCYFGRFIALYCIPHLP